LQFSYPVDANAVARHLSHISFINSQLSSAAVDSVNGAKCQCRFGFAQTAILNAMAISGTVAADSTILQ